jgi:hypothetical protein
MDDVVAAIGTDASFIVAMPPCRDLCAAGARWWTKKSGRDPGFQRQAARYLSDLYNTLVASSVPFVVLVPSSRLIKSCFPRKAFVFNPHEYGGFLPRDAPHPLFSTIPSQDAYTKRTLCFTSPGIRMPWKRPVPPTYVVVRLKNGKAKNLTPIMSDRRNRGARSAPPLGFCTALCAQVTPTPPTTAAGPLAPASSRAP